MFRPSPGCEFRASPPAGVRTRPAPSGRKPSTEDHHQDSVSTVTMPTVSRHTDRENSTAGMSHPTEIHDEHEKGTCTSSMASDSWSLCPSVSPSTFPLSTLDDIFTQPRRRTVAKKSSVDATPSQGPSDGMDPPPGHPLPHPVSPIVDADCPSGSQDDDGLAAPPIVRTSTPPPNKLRQGLGARRPPPLQIPKLCPEEEATALIQQPSPPPPVQSAIPPKMVPSNPAPRPRTASTSTATSYSRRISGPSRSPRDPSFFTVSQQSSGVNHTAPFLLEVPGHANPCSPDSSISHCPVPKGSSVVKRNSTSTTSGSSRRRSGRSSQATPPQPTSFQSSPRPRPVVLHCMSVTEMARTAGTPVSTGLAAVRAKQSQQQLVFYD